MKNEKSDSMIIVNFGDDFGTLSKQDIGQLFVEIHATISPLDPLGMKAANETNAAC